MRLYNLILYLIFQFVYLPKQCLAFIIPNKRNRERYLKMMLDDGYVGVKILEKQTPSKTGDKIRKKKKRDIPKNRLLFLTRKGIVYLKEQYPDSLFRFISSKEIRNVTPYGKRVVSVNNDIKNYDQSSSGIKATPQQLRISEIGAVAAMVYGAGGDIPYILNKTDKFCNKIISSYYAMNPPEGYPENVLSFYDDVPVEGRVSSHDSVYRHPTTTSLLERFEFLSRELSLFSLGNEYMLSPALDKYIGFYSSITLKDILIQASYESTAKDFNRMDIAGIIQSHHKCVLVHVNSKDGFIWSSSYAARERAAVGHWNRSLDESFYTDYDKRLVCEAAIVNSPYHLRSIYTDQRGVRLKTIDGEVNYLGKDVDNMYIFPVAENCGPHLRRIMLENDDMVNQQGLYAFKAEHETYANQDMNNSTIFPIFIVEDGKKIFLTPELTLDILHAKRIEDEMMKYPDVKFGVICEEWQKEYWEAMLPNIEVRFVEEDLYMYRDQIRELMDERDKILETAFVPAKNLPGYDKKLKRVVRPEEMPGDDQRDSGASEEIPEEEDEEIEYEFMEDDDIDSDTVQDVDNFI